MDYRGRLEKRRRQKLNEIAAAIASELGYGAFASLAAGERIRLQREAWEAIGIWEHMVEMEARPKEPSTPLQALLREHHNICEDIWETRER